MLYCSNCRNIYDITKNVSALQTGGDKKKDDDIDDETENSDNTVEVSDIVLKILSNIKIEKKDVGYLTITQFVSSPSYKKLSNEKKEFVYNTISELLQKKNTSDTNSETNGKKIGPKPNDSSNAYYICGNCGNKEIIKSGTVLIKHIAHDNTESANNQVITKSYKNIVHANYFPHTRRYVCPNKSCVSHKNFEKRDAVFTRIKNSYRVVYVCTACEEQWHT